MTGHGAKFGHKQEAAIAAALLTHRGVPISMKTRLRWLKRPEFVKAYRATRHAAFSQAVARFQHATSAPATTLLKIMIDASAPSSCRMRAADSLLSHAATTIVIEDIEARVTELERATEASAKAAP